ncbi:MAG: ABC transporter permease [Brevefilum sp.]
MFAIFRRKLLKNWLMILGWGIGLGILAFYLFDIYDTFFQQEVNLEQLLNAFPSEMLAFFGGEDIDIFSPSGFLHLEFFSYMPIILGIMAVTSAANLITQSEEEGSLELILAQPVSRSVVFWGRTLALILSVVLILVITWGGAAIGLETHDFDITQRQLVKPYISLASVLMMFLSLALFLSMVLPSSGAAGLTAGFLLIASFFVSSLASIDENLEGVNRFSPMKYYQGGTAVEGLDQKNLLILFGLAILFLLLAWFFFTKRDMRFGGTGGVRLVFKRREES